MGQHDRGLQSFSTTRGDRPAATGGGMQHMCLPYGQDDAPLVSRQKRRGDALMTRAIKLSCESDTATNPHRGEESKWTEGRLSAALRCIIHAHSGRGAHRARRVDSAEQHKGGRWQVAHHG